MCLVIPRSRSPLAYGWGMKKHRVLITVKTYPVPSKTYDELVCTAGITSEGEFIRLYPINFRELSYSEQYRKYEWIEIEAEKHTQDKRKESWRPNCETLSVASHIGTKLDPHWVERGKHILPLVSASMEELYLKQKEDNTSLGIIRPREILDLEISRTESSWSAGQLAQLKQARLWETRDVTKTPPRKIPWYFRYRFRCDDPECTGKHKMMTEDWEVGAFYWRMFDDCGNHEKAAEATRVQFLDKVCAPDRDVHFFVGTVLAHGTWVIIGVYWPKKEDNPLFG